MLSIADILILVVFGILVWILLKWKRESFWGGTPLPYAGQSLQKWGRYAVQAQTPIPVLMTDNCAKCVNLPCPQISV